MMMHFWGIVMFWFLLLGQKLLILSFVSLFALLFLQASVSADVATTSVETPVNER